MKFENIIDALNSRLQIHLIEFKEESHDLEESKGYIVDDNGNITSLFLNYCQIKEMTFFEDFKEAFSNLTELQLSGNKINDIGALRHLKSLKRLKLVRNEVKDISVLCSMKDLQILDLANNIIIDLDGLSSLSNLTFLSLKGNVLRSCSELSSLHSLTHLFLGEIEMADYEFLGSLINLKTLSIEKVNSVRITFLMELTGLQSLTLTGGEITNIDSISNLSNLIRLNLSSNSIKNISPLKSLSKLTSLNINFNKIESLEPIRNLKLLRNLEAHENYIKNIEALEELYELRLVFLDGANNREKLDCSPLKNLTNLTDLSLEYIQLADLSFLEKLENVEALWLKNNNLKDLSYLKFLRNIEAIDLRMNPIEKLPHWITDLNLSIQWKDELERGVISLYENPIETPPLTVIKQGNEAIKRYFDKILNQGVDYIYEVKLTLVGEGSAGKTSLQARLMDLKADLPKKDTRTRGIKIYDWEFKKHKQKNHIAHIWDFGGQDVYYPVHRFFLTENSVFVLLASTRQSHHNFDYWIPTIFQFGGKSPIIIGQTCHDGNRVPWNDLGYYVGNNLFNIIKLQSLPYIELNLPKRNEGLTKMKKAIVDQIVHLPHYGKGVPKSWLEVRVLIAEETKKSACITFDKFEEICNKANPEAFVDFVDIEDCAKFLHSIGVILWYYNHNELREWVILQPDWAMNAVYMIIDDEKIQTRRGNILSDDFERLWKSKLYIGKFNTLKKMLEVFKIAFPKKHKKNEYIIPARLVSMPSENRWKLTEPFLRLEYRFQFMPKGLVNQVSAELSRYISSDEFVWNNAVNISTNDKMSECQIEEDFYNRQISLKARGKDARSLIMLSMNAIKDISEEYKGVKPDIYVPCVCKECITSAVPTTYLYSNLLRWSLRKNDAVVTCNESSESLLIEELLFNVGLATIKKENIQKMNKTIKLFLASSSELSEDRKEFEIFVNRENRRLNKQGIFLDLHLWEDFIDTISSTRLQDEYNKAVRASDIVVSLFFSKVGKFTLEEFEVAWKQFQDSGKPYIYTYFKDASLSSRSINMADINSLRIFEEQLKNIGHFPTNYNNIDDLKYKFKVQLDKIIELL